MLPVSSASLAAQLMGRQSSPSQAAIRAEVQIRLQEALNTLEPLDREVLALRHFEELSNNEAAQVLGLSKAAASKNRSSVTSAQAEIARLKREVTKLKAERDILKKAAAYFAKEST